MRERIRHTNRIRGLLFGQGITNYNLLHKNRRQRLGELRTGDGRPLPARLKAEIFREIDRLELVLCQITEVEAERDEMLRPARASSPAALLMRLKGIGAEFAAVLSLEGLFRPCKVRFLMPAEPQIRSPFSHGWHHNPSSLRSSGSGGRIHTVWRHLAATVCDGPPARIQRG